MLTLRSPSSSVKLVKSLPCCAVLSIAFGSTLQELSHLCTTLHFATYVCSSCLLYMRVTRRRADEDQCRSRFLLAAVDLGPWSLLKCFLLSSRAEQERWRLRPSRISCCWAVAFPLLREYVTDLSLIEQAEGGFEFVSFTSRVRLPLKRLE